LEITDNDSKLDKTKIVSLLRESCEKYMQKEVLPHASDSWVDYKKIKIGYEIPFHKYFYKYIEPRMLGQIQSDIDRIEKEVLELILEGKNEQNK